MSMNNKKHWLMMAATATVALTVAVSCSKKESGTNASSSGSGGNATPGVVRQIDVPRYQSDLPGAEGREAFATACLSCHTTMYIGSQPPLTADKWEAEVKKMKTVYGALVADEQIKPIVSYLMAVKEGNSSGHIREALVAAKSTDPLVKMARDPADRADDAKRGELVFQQFCSPCHGTEGHGDGPAGLVLLPHPADLATGRLSDTGVAEVVAHGIPGTGMASFGKMPEKDLRAVQSYVQSLCPDDGPSPAQSEEGKQLYLQNCAACHGADGAGDGIAGVLLPRQAANFHLRRPTLDHAQQVIADGVPGTAMPAWKTKLSEPQRTALAEYVRGFFKDE